MKFEGLLARASGFANSTLSVRSGAADAVAHSFPEFVADVRALQDSLLAAGVLPGQLVGLQAAGSYEFVVWDLALIDLGAVPHVYPEDWSPAQIQAMSPSPGLAHRLTAQDGALPLRGTAPREFLCGRLHSQAVAPPVTGSDLLTQVYSSGTTGRYKGLRISRRGAEDIAEQFKDSFQVDHADRYLFFLPFSHFQQRHSVYLCLYHGISMHWTPYARVFHDLRRFKPTFLMRPPSQRWLLRRWLATTRERWPVALVARSGS
jgi:long-subunit acyl-CoA synthetase (AMP-forming)